jgi:hypothetical protein
MDAALGACARQGEVARLERAQGVDDDGRLLRDDLGDRGGPGHVDNQEPRTVRAHHAHGIAGGDRVAACDHDVDIAVPREIGRDAAPEDAVSAKDQYDGTRHSVSLPKSLLPKSLLRKSVFVR